jgi:hypothetical protein
MMAESRTAALACTTSYVPFEIIPSYTDPDQLPEVLGGFFVQVRKCNMGGEDCTVRVFGSDVCGHF